MKNLTTIENRYLSVSNEQTVFAFFSEKAARQFGYFVAEIEDHKNSKYINKNILKKEIHYTATSSDENGVEHMWPDKKVIWSGKLSDLHFIKTVKEKKTN